MNRTLFSACLLLFFPSLSLFAQVHNGIHDTDRVKAIYDVAEYVVWPQEEGIDTFRIAYMGGDIDLYEEIVRQRSRKIHGKEVEVLHLRKPEELEAENFHLLFLQRRENYDLSEVKERLAGKGVLSIAENHPFYQSMVTFIFHDGVTRYYLYRKPFLEKGFSYEDPLENLAEVKTQADWKRAFKQTEDRLSEKRKEVEAQEKALEALQSELEKKQELLSEKEEEVREKRRILEEQQDSLQELGGAVKERERELQEKRAGLAEKEGELEETRLAIEEQEAVLSEQKASIDSQDARIMEQREKIEEQVGTLRAKETLITYQRSLIYLFVALILVVLASAWLLYRSNKRVKAINRQLEEKNRTILEQNERIEEKNKEITESITYASKIQQAMLPALSVIEECFHDRSVLYIPRDIVSGDFYWAGKSGDKVIWTAADCTGHGVPGAMMSMLGMAYLKELVSRQGIHEPAEILNELRRMIVRALASEGEEKKAKDGMDMGLCSYTEGTGELAFAGANNPLYLVFPSVDDEREAPEDSKEILDENGERRGLEIKADKQPVGAHPEQDEPFNAKRVRVKKGDRIYLFSDGYADQFGGDKGKKLKYKPFKRLILESADKGLEEQRSILQEHFEEWKGDYEQVDDVVIVTVEI